MIESRHVQRCRRVRLGAWNQFQEHRLPLCPSPSFHHGHSLNWSNKIYKLGVRMRKHESIERFYYEGSLSHGKEKFRVRAFTAKQPNRCLH